jgi:bifunctional DNA-binding transcriptional regulator/antitoxin component of YhaV-PrlF toxin-antitoxin module
VKKYPKIIQCDKRGQIVIPIDIRRELGIDESTGFYMYSITEEGILLKKVEPKNFEDNEELLQELEEKADKIKLNPKNLEKTKKDYKKTKEGNLEII